MKFLKLLVAAVLAACTINAKEADWPKEIVFGAIPTAGSSSMEDSWGGVVKYLEKNLEIKIKLQISSDYAGVITGMAHKHIDVAYLGPESYAEASKRANALAIVAEVQEGKTQPGYYGVIITKKDSGLTTLKSLKGKVWAFTDPQSTSGTLVPTVMFHKKGIDPHKYFGKVLYSGSHQSSILSVKAGRVDAASTNDLDFNKGAGINWDYDDFSFIWKSDLIVGSPIAVRKDLPKSLIDELQRLLTQFDDKETLGKLKYSGFVKINDSEYDSIRDLIDLKKQLAQ